MVAATLLVAAHGTHSVAGSATTASLVAAVAAIRPNIPVALCFLDVAPPSLDAALADLGGTGVVVVPLLLSAGYHVETDIPTVVTGRAEVRVAAHLGPDPAIVAAVADRLAEAGGPGDTTFLAAIGSTRGTARAEVATAARLLAVQLGRPVEVLLLGPDLASALARRNGPLAVAVYLLAEGGFLDTLRSSVGEAGVVAAPIGVHPELVSLVWSRYDAALR